MNIAPSGRGAFLPAEGPARQQTLIVLTTVALFVIAGIDPRLALLLAGGVIGLAALLTLSSRPYIGVCALVAVGTFETVRLLPAEGETGTVSKIVGAAVAAGWALALLRGRVRLPSLRSSFPVVGAILFVAWSTLTVTWAADTGMAVAKTTSIGLLILSTIIAATSIGANLQMRRVAQIHVALALCVAVVSVVAALTGEGISVEYQPWGTEEQVARASGFTGDPNEFAAAQVLALSVTIALAGSATALTTKVLSASAAVVITGAILATASRGGLLAFTVVIVLWMASSRRTIFWIVPVIAAFLALNALDAFDAILGRINVAGPDSRLLIWDVGLNLWRDQFVHGLGTGGFPDAFVANQFRSSLPIPSIDRPIVAHNIFLGVAAETGLIGLLFFLGMLAATFAALANAARHAGTNRVRSLARGYSIGLIAFLVAALFLSAELSKWLWLVVGLSTALARLAEDAPYIEET